MSFEEFIQREWQDYCQVTPLALTVHDLLTSQGEIVTNDHIAIRTLAHPNLGLEAFESFLTGFGYKPCQEYFFEDKRLKAIHFEAKDKPLIFVSEFMYEDDKFSDFVTSTMESIIESCDGLNLEQLFLKRKVWMPSYAIYEKLLNESEYAAWFYAWGFRSNHFTISANKLKKFSTIEQINTFLKSHKIALNSSGGEVKGTEQQGLVQSSTMADQYSLEFLEGMYTIPSCYYEFAKRYELDGSIYTGFVPTSADKIFESTNRN